MAELTPALIDVALIASLLAAGWGINGGTLEDGEVPKVLIVKPCIIGKHVSVARYRHQELVAAILAALSVEFKLHYLRGDWLFLVESGGFIPFTLRVPGESLNEDYAFNLIISRSLLECGVQPLELVVPKVSEPDNNRKGA